MTLSDRVQKPRPQFERVRCLATRASGLTFDRYPWKLHNRIKDETRSVDAAHLTTWKFIILVELAKLLLQEAEETNSKSAQVEQLSKFVHEAYGTHRPGLNDLLSGLIDPRQHSFLIGACPELRNR